MMFATRKSRAILAAPFILWGLSPFASRAAELTFSKDVSPILQKHCQECHRPGEPVPMSLTSYKEVRPWVKSIKKAVMERQMPPWHADPAIGEWRNERRLSDEEIQKLAAWVDAGAPMGDPLDSPPARKFKKGWKIGDPDAVFSFRKDQVLPESLKDEYRYVAMRTDYKEDRWLKAIECRPGNAEVVHHIIAFTAAPGLSPQKAGGGLGNLAEGMSLLGGYAPGMNPFVFTNGMGILLPAGATIIFQMHYHKEAGQSATDRSSVGLKFADYPVAKQYRADAVFNPLLSIPPNAANHEVNALFTAKSDMELQTVLPHMHLRGKDMKVWAKFPDGTERDVIWVPKYDFNWQTIYELKTPLFLPKGSKLYAKAHYDNSANNPNNPDPNATVRFGEETTAEMMFAFISYTLPNENLNARDPQFTLIGGGGR